MAAPATPEEKVSALAARFTTAGFGHAFGGDVALAALTQTRPVSRIDLHLFAAPPEAPAVLARLAVLGLPLDRASAIDRIAVRGALEVRWAGTPLGLRFGLDGLHALARPRVRRVPFAERFVYVLSAEDVALEMALAAGAGQGAAFASLSAALFTELDHAYLRRALALLDPSGPLPELERWLATGPREMARP